RELRFLDVVEARVAPAARVPAAELVPHNGHEPALGLAGLAQRAPGGPRPHARFLNHVLGGVPVAAQPVGVAIQVRAVRADRLLELVPTLADSGSPLRPMPLLDRERSPELTRARNPRIAGSQFRPGRSSMLSDEIFVSFVSLSSDSCKETLPLEVYSQSATITIRRYGQRQGLQRELLLRRRSIHR